VEALEAVAASAEAEPVVAGAMAVGTAAEMAATKINASQ
jgi:hypothetical protein